MGMLASFFDAHESGFTEREHDFRVQNPSDKQKERTALLNAYTKAGGKRLDALGIDVGGKGGLWRREPLPSGWAIYAVNADLVNKDGRVPKDFKRLFGIAKLDYVCGGKPGYEADDIFYHSISGKAHFLVTPKGHHALSLAAKRVCAPPARHAIPARSASPALSSHPSPPAPSAPCSPISSRAPRLGSITAATRSMRSF